MLKDNLIMFFPLVDWDGPWQRYQHLASRFSKNNRVVYMNSPVAITYLMRNPLTLLKKWIRFLKGKSEINPNLTCYFPPPCLPFERLNKWVNLLNQYILFFYIKFFVKPKGTLILWINDPYKYLLRKLLRPKITVYDCPDAIVFKNNDRKQKFYDELKKKVIQDSTVSLFTSNALLEEGKKYSPHCYYVPNGVDVETFERKKYEKFDRTKKVSGPILGLVGTIDERIDLDLIVYVVENIPESTVFLVGPVQTGLGDLYQHPRVIITGKRGYGEIPSFINQFNVGLIPYRVSDVTEAVYPVKLHEYLILGKPVVSTNLPEVRPFVNVVRIAKTKGEFVRAIRRTLKENNADSRKKRVEIAKENSWEKRVDQIKRIVTKYY
ncbi:MAG: glycosyltransferase [Candidatus Hodarchaeota archaeon]